MNAPNRFVGISAEMWPAILGKIKDLQQRNPHADEEMLFETARDWVWANQLADTQLFFMRLELALSDPEERPEGEDF